MKTLRRNTKGNSIKIIKKTNGITIIALIITIIVLLILAGVSIATLTGENGILVQANNAKNNTDEKGALEEVQLETAGSFDNQGNYQVEIAKQNLKKNLEIPEDDITQKGDTLKIKYKGYKFNIDIKGKVSISNAVNVGEIFDSTGEIEGKLHIGDFINYTAGTWTETEIEKVVENNLVNNSTVKPSTAFQFGGFTKDSSRDGNAKPYIDSYNYVKDKATGNAVQGWRVFDVEDGKITLISAGCPEDYYYHNATNYAYISEYILTGNINSNASADSLGLGSTYKIRDWSMYLNEEYKQTGEATVLTKEKLDIWYSKYMDIDNAATSFQSVYGTKYESMVDNYSYYWLSSAYSDNYVYCVYPNFRSIAIGDGNVGYAFGLRVLVTLPSDVQLSEKSIGTKTITSRDVDYNYNVWDLE